jgi:hypothetical protein
MPFEKGKSGNPDGRPQGARSKKSQEWEQLGEFILNEGANKAKAYLLSLEGAEFFDKYTILLNYFKPKIKSSHIELDASIESRGAPSWFGKPIDLYDDDENPK